MMNMTTKKITTLGMLCGLAVIVNLLIHFPLIPSVEFLSYDAKDVIIVIGGFIYGAGSAFIMSVITSLLEIMYRGGNLLDVLMNVISTCTFACVPRGSISVTIRAGRIHRIGRWYRMLRPQHAAVELYRHADLFRHAQRGGRQHPDPRHPAIQSAQVRTEHRIDALSVQADRRGLPPDFAGGAQQRRRSCHHEGNRADRPVHLRVSHLLHPGIPGHHLKEERT